MYGYPVNLFETNEKIRNSVKEIIKEELIFLAENEMFEKEKIEGVLSRITVTDDLKKAVENVEYVIEAVPEIMDLKKEIFGKLDQFCKEDTIFASNTSTLFSVKLFTIPLIKETDSKALLILNIPSILKNDISPFTHKIKNIFVSE